MNLKQALPSVTSTYSINPLNGCIIPRCTLSIGNRWSTFCRRLFYSFVFLTRLDEVRQIAPIGSFAAALPLFSMASVIHAEQKCLISTFPNIRNDFLIGRAFDPEGHLPAQNRPKLTVERVGNVERGFKCSWKRHGHNRQRPNVKTNKHPYRNRGGRASLAYAHAV